MAEPDNEDRCGDDLPEPEAEESPPQRFEAVEGGHGRFSDGRSAVEQNSVGPPR